MARKKKLTEKLKNYILSLFADGLTIRELFSRDDVDFTWQSWRTYLLDDNELMNRYVKSKELAQDLKISELEDKRKELEKKIESGEVDGKAGQNLTNLYKILTAHTQWSASKLAKKYSKSAELTLKGSEEPINISWTKN